MDVVCLAHASRKRSKRIASAMMQGMHRLGDRIVMPGRGQACIGYGWKFHRQYEQYPSYAYADLGYWNRDTYYRFAVNGWSPEKYVRQGLSSKRFERLGLDIKPWQTGGEEIIVAGSTAKACADHGVAYQSWERSAIERLKATGRPVVYRPKPNDVSASAIGGVPVDRRPIKEALQSAYAVVTHHSNTAIDALLAGIPVHCETGAAAAFSVPLDQIGEAPRLEGREQFLFDVAWLQWTLEEMKSGDCWRHLRKFI